MKFVSVRELRLRPGQVWEQLNEDEEVVITANGKPIALVTGIRENDLMEEIDALRRARALLALDKIHRHSVHRGTDRLSDEEIETEIRAVRAERPR